MTHIMECRASGVLLVIPEVSHLLHRADDAIGARPGEGPRRRDEPEIDSDGAKRDAAPTPA